MDYGKAYLFMTRKPKTGFKNVLMGAILSLIPVIGPIVLSGYITVIAEWLLKDEKRERYPDFNFDHFMEYLKLGVWPFLMTMILSFTIFMPLYGISFGAGFLAGYLTNIPAFMFVIGIIGGFLAGTIFSVLAGTMMFYSQKVQKFDLGGALRFTKKFIKTVGGLYLITILINSFVSSFLMFVGLLLCFIGIYPAVALVQFAYEHLFIQLYDEYLKRGGEPLPEVKLPPELAYVNYPDKPLTPEQANYDDPEFR